jgi:queuosine precursor transporter
MKTLQKHIGQKAEGYIYLALFCLCIPLANWMIGNVGSFCVPDGPCMIPVWPGVAAPSGVLVVGVAFVLRDLVQRRLGLKWSLLAIALGAALSWGISPPQLVLASAVAFLVSELADTVVFTPLQRRGLVIAVLASGFIGICIDSVLFLTLAFGSLDFLAGQIIGKLWSLLFALPLIHLIRQNDKKHGMVPAL